MKIHQLPMGARFAYEGEEYVKTGPPLVPAERQDELAAARAEFLKALD